MDPKDSMSGSELLKAVDGDIKDSHDNNASIWDNEPLEYLCAIRRWSRKYFVSVSFSNWSWIHE